MPCRPGSNTRPRTELYGACLRDARTGQAYLCMLNGYVEQNFGDGLKALNGQRRIRVPVMARGFVGAHLVILEGWLAGELDGDIEELASMALDLYIAGGAWAQGIRLDELGYATGSPADAGNQAPATTKARSRDILRLPQYSRDPRAAGERCCG